MVCLKYFLKYSVKDPEMFQNVEMLKCLSDFQDMLIYTLFVES